MTELNSPSSEGGKEGRSGRDGGRGGGGGPGGEEEEEEEEGSCIPPESSAQHALWLLVRWLPWKPYSTLPALE